MKKADKKILKIIEVNRADLQKKLPKISPSDKKKKVYKPLDKKLKTALDKFGGKGAKIASFHSEYYTARGAELLLELKANPSKHYGTKTIRKRLVFTNLKNGRYLVERDGVPDKKTYKWKQVERLQRKQNRERKIRFISDRIGASESDIRAIIKRIEREERVSIRKYKKTKEYKGKKWKERKKITITRRVNAVFGAMTDLLEIYGSPKATKEHGQSANWKKFGDVWAVKEGKKWFEKTGPDHWQELIVRNSKRRKKK